MTRKDELEAQELEAKFRPMTEAEKEEEAQQLLEYDQYQARSGSIRIGMR